MISLPTSSKHFGKKIMSIIQKERMRFFSKHFFKIVLPGQQKLTEILGEKKVVLFFINIGNRFSTNINKNINKLNPAIKHIC